MDLICGVRIFYFGLIFFIFELSRFMYFVVLKLVKESGVLLFYDFNLWLFLWFFLEVVCDRIMSIWCEVDIIKVLDEEVKFFINGGDEKLDEVIMSLYY